MADFKVYFNANILFPKSRISGKVGNISLGYEGTIEQLREDEDLKKFIAQSISNKLKTGKVFSIDVTKIDEV